MQRHLLPVFALSFTALDAFAAISGTILTTDGRPVAGARVSLRAFESTEARKERLLSKSPAWVALASSQTDSKGSFSIESPKEAVVDLNVYASGYEPHSRRVEREEDIGSITLQNADLVRGVVSAAGKPVAGASVALYYGGYEHFSTTDAHGRYEAPDLKRLRHIIVVHPDFAVDEESRPSSQSLAASRLNRTLAAGTPVSGRVVSAGSSPVAEATVFADGWPLATSGEDGSFTIDRAPLRWKVLSARKESLAGQRTASHDQPHTIQLTRSATLTGQVTDAKSKLPIAGAIVTLRERRPMSTDLGISVQTDAKGRYSMFSAPGSYNVVASHPAYQLEQRDIGATAGQTSARDLTLIPRVRVSGTVVDEARKPVAGAIIALEDAGMATMGGGMRFRSRDETPVSGPDGHFNHRFDMESEREVWIRAAKAGLPSAKSEPFTLAPGDRRSGIVITIPAGIEVSGSVKDREGNPLSGVAVTPAESQGSRGVMIRRVIGGPQREDDAVRTASDGSFTMRLKEGTYDFAFRREGYAPNTVRGHVVRPADAQPVEATLEPAVEISGRVLRSGTPLENVRIVAGGETDAMTAPDGSFTLSGLAAGTTRVTLVREDDFLSEMRNLTAPARDVIIDLPAGGRITGRVVEKGSKKAMAAFQAGVNISGVGGGMARMAPPQMRQFTNEDGSFVLDHVPAGAAIVVASAPGYASTRLNLTVEEGKTISGVELELDAGVKLTGRVTGSSGSPLSDVRVRLMPSPTGGFGISGMDRTTTTDANGEYVLEALEAGEERVIFSHAKHTPLTKPVTLKGKETRVDVQLSSGLKVTGSVVTEAGAPVAEAEVFVSSGSTGTMVPTNASGTFEAPNLAAGRYRFSARKSGFAEGVVEDVDISEGAPVRITMPLGGTIYGRVTGLNSEDYLDTSVSAMSGRARATAAVDSSGNYRIEGAPIGSVRVTADVISRSTGSRKSAAPQTVEVRTGGSHQIDLDFGSGIVVQGRVSRNGVPLRGGDVTFAPRNASTGGYASSPIDESGRYSVSGVQEGDYTVRVMDMQRFSAYSTPYQVRGSATFDVDYRTGLVRGRVTDAETGEAVSNADVNMRSTTPTEGFMPSRGAVTDAAGAFVFDTVPPGTHIATASKHGYANQLVEVQVGDREVDGLEIKIARNEGVTLKVIDARDGRPLRGTAFVYDMQGRLVHEEGRMFYGGGGSTDTGELKLRLAPGTYSVSVSASGYAARNFTLQSPSSPTIALSPGGTLIIHSQQSDHRFVRLIDATGTPYPRFSAMPAQRGLVPSPGTTTIPNVAAGSYTLQLLGDNDVILDQKQIVVNEGQTVTTEM